MVQKIEQGSEIEEEEFDDAEELEEEEQPQQIKCQKQKQV